MNKPMQETGNFPERQVKQYAGVTESGLQVILTDYASKKGYDLSVSDRTNELDSRILSAEEELSQRLKVFELDIDGSVKGMTIDTVGEMQIGEIWPHFEATVETLRPIDLLASEAIKHTAA